MFTGNTDVSLVGRSGNVFAPNLRRAAANFPESCNKA